MNGQVYKNYPSFLQKVHNSELWVLTNFGVDPNWNVLEHGCKHYFKVQYKSPRSLKPM
jgi:hypothetical protein